MIQNATFQICDHFNDLKRKGRPRKQANHHAKMLLHRAITNSTPPPSTNPTYIKEYINTPPRSSIECPLCCDVLSQPVQLDCCEIVCSSCCHHWIEAALQPSCPCCYSLLTVKPAPSNILTLLDSLIVTCTKCNHNVKAGQHVQHLDSGCSECILTPSPTQTEKTRGEIQRMLSESPDGNTITIPARTSGKVH